MSHNDKYYTISAVRLPFSLIAWTLIPFPVRLFEQVNPWRFATSSTVEDVDRLSDRTVREYDSIVIFAVIY